MTLSHIETRNSKTNAGLRGSICNELIESKTGIEGVLLGMSPRTLSQPCAAPALAQCGPGDYLELQTLL
jgi:hypothetical protein